jgi:hypothetical protein
MLVPLIVLASAPCWRGFVLATSIRRREDGSSFWGDAIFFAPDNHVPH